MGSVIDQSGGRRCGSMRTAGWLLVVVLLCTVRAPLVGQSVSWTATFENIGIEVNFPSATPNDGVIETAVREESPGTAFKRTHDLSRISDTRFAGSLFELRPGRVYVVRLTSALFDPAKEFRVHTRSDQRVISQGAVYHVSPTTGSDSNGGGGLADALATLGRALTIARAGDRILLHSGTYHEGDLVVLRSGTLTSPITIEAAEGAVPVLDGTDPGFNPQWEVFDAANHLYRTPCVSQPDKGYLDGQHLFRYRRLEDLTVLRWGMPSGFFVDGTHLYARFPQNGVPANHVVSIPRFTTGITFERKAHWQVRGLGFQYFGFGPFHRGVYLDGADHILVDQCQFRFNGVGVGIKRDADWNLIQGCRFVDSPIASWDWHAVKSGGVGYEAGGIFVYNSNTPNRGNVIRNNQFTDQFDGAHLFSSNVDGPTCNMDFYGNEVSLCLDDGAETDGGGINNRIYRNVFRGFLTGLSCAPAFLGPTYVFRNVFYDWNSVAEFTGYPLKFNVNTTHETQFVYLYHNTCYTAFPGQDGFLFKNYSLWKQIVSRNNIYAGTDYAFESQSATNPIDFNFDNLYSSHGSRFARWLGADYPTLGAFQQASGQESRGLAVAPAFVEPGSGDFTLQMGSPLIDAGARIPGINDDFRGSGPDIGAFEAP